MGTLAKNKNNKEWTTDGKFCFLGIKKKKGERKKNNFNSHLITSILV